MKPVMCEKKTYTVAEIMQILGIGRTAAYDLTRKGLFKVIRVGKILRINKESFINGLTVNNKGGMRDGCDFKIGKEISSNLRGSHTCKRNKND